MNVELLFKFNFKANDTELNYRFIENFVKNFIEEKGWECGGGTYMGMFDPKNKTSYNTLKEELTKYLKNHSEVVSSIVINDYDNNKDELVPKEEIFV